jgi:hypothetical protein
MGKSYLPATAVGHKEGSSVDGKGWQGEEGGVAGFAGNVVGLLAHFLPGFERDGATGADGILKKGSDFVAPFAQFLSGAVIEIKGKSEGEGKNLGDIGWDAVVGYSGTEGCAVSPEFEGPVS